MRTCIILNPTAGAGADPVRLERVAAALGQAHLAVTREPGDATRLASAAAAGGCRTVVAAGGDGTVGEVVSGLLPGFPAVRLGVIPLGTGNDLARGYGIPLRLDAAVDLLRAAPVRALDVVRLEGGAGTPAFFANALVGGFAGGIGRRLGRGMKRRLGPLSYLAAAVGELRELTARRATLRLDEHELLEIDSFMVVLANGPYAGGRIPLAPAARPDDGLLDVLVVPAMSAAALAVEASRILLGRHGGSRRLVFRRARRLRLELDPAGEVNVDGESRPGAPLALELLPSALRIVAPPRRDAG